MTHGNDSNPLLWLRMSCRDAFPNQLKAGMSARWYVACVRTRVGGRSSMLEPRLSRENMGARSRSAGTRPVIDLRNQHIHNAEFLEHRCLMRFRRCLPSTSSPSGGTCVCVCVCYRVCHQVDLVWNVSDPPKDTNDGTSDDGLILGYY